MAEVNHRNKGAKITLHWLNQSRSQRILWLLEELGIDYDIKVYHRLETKMAPPELKGVHPLGKSPVITVVTPASPEPKVIAESALIIEYLSKYFGKWLIPKEYPEGREDEIGGETDEYMRYRYFMHYAEGSLMTLMLAALIVLSIRNSPAPVRPVANIIADGISSLLVEPNLKTHYDFLEGQLATSPGGGEYLCGKELTGADILMSFPLEKAQERGGMSAASYPKLTAYVERLHERDAYKRAVQKIIDVDGSYESNLK
ncbi:MAG: hypothetical protein M1819_004229 [Sarea resinae]|nr:MAG: hypothetical protein M1819_004229 [Sarea resinae]